MVSRGEGGGGATCDGRREIRLRRKIESPWKKKISVSSPRYAITRIHTCACVHAYAYIHKWPTSMYADTRVNVACTHAQKHTTHTYAHIHASLYTHIHLHACIYTHTRAIIGTRPVLWSVFACRQQIKQQSAFFFPRFFFRLSPMYLTSNYEYSLVYPHTHIVPLSWCK
jgi:hypothetical protein